MRVLLLLAAFLRPAWGAGSRGVGGPESPVAIPALSGPAPIVSLHPLLVGDLGVPENPAARHSVARAAALAGDARQTGLPVGEAARRLLPLAAPYAAPADRFAAGLIAGLLTSPPLSENLFRASPGLRETALGRLPNLLAATDYRTSPVQSAVGRIAKDAMMDPALAAVFDGGAGKPSLEIEGLFRGFWGLSQSGLSLFELGSNDLGKAYLHPTIPGVEVVVADKPFDRMTVLGNVPHDAADLDEEMSRRLASLGLGPRYFGRSMVSGRRGKAYPLSVRERVHGKNVKALIAGYDFGADKQALVQDLYDRAFARRLQVPALRDPGNIVIGETTAEPTPRAYLVRADTAYRDLDTPEARMRASYDSWMKNFLMEVDVLRARLREIYSPMRGWK